MCVQVHIASSQWLEEYRRLARAATGARWWCRRAWGTRSSLAVREVAVCVIPEVVGNKMKNKILNIFIILINKNFFFL